MSTMQDTPQMGAATFPPKTLREEAGQFTRQELIHSAPPLI